MPGRERPGVGATGARQRIPGPGLLLRLASCRKGLKSALLELGDEPPHTHVLNDLVGRLKQNGLDTRVLDALPLRSLSRMAIQSRYPMDATPPSELFDPEEADQALTTAGEVLTMLKALDQDTDS